MNVNQTLIFVKTLFARDGKRKEYLDVFMGWQGFADFDNEKELKLYKCIEMI